MKKLFLIAVLIFCAMGASSANAGYCYNRNYGHNNYYHNDVVIVNEKRVIFDARYFLGLDGYYDVGASLYNQSLREKTEQINENLIRIQGQNEAIIKILGNKPLPPININPPTDQPPAPPVIDPAPVPEQPKPQPEDNGNGETKNGSELDKKVFAIFQTHCASCHAEKASGGLKLIVDGQMNKPALAEMVKLGHRVKGVKLKGEQRMPPKPKPALSDEDVSTIEDWIYEEANNLLK